MPAAYVLPSASNSAVGAVDLDPGHLQLLDEVPRFARVVLRLHGDEDRLHVAGPAGVDGLPC